MKTYKAIIILVIVLGVAGLVWYLASPDATEHLQVSFDPQNASFVIDGDDVVLEDGVWEAPIAPDSAIMNTVRYFGNEAQGDLNLDGQDDMVFLVTQEMGGSGTFYYAVAALSTDDGYITTNPVFIGDRIAPQSTVILVDSQEIQINYATRIEGEPMATLPSQGVTLRLTISSIGTLISVQE